MPNRSRLLALVGLLSMAVGASMLALLGDRPGHARSASVQIALSSSAPSTHRAVWMGRAVPAPAAFVDQ